MNAIEDQEPAEDESGDVPLAPDEQEPEEPEEAEQQPEPEQEPEPAHGLSEAQLEKRIKSAEQRWNRYSSGIQDLYADELEHLAECPLCPTQHKGFIDMDFAGMVPDEVVDVVQRYLGLARALDYKPSQQHRTCTSCDGHGKVQTGSRVPGNETIVCAGCKGYGYTPPPDEGRNGSDAAASFHAPAGEGSSPLVSADRDSWGEPKILPDGRANPNYGKMPQFKVPVPPFGITANLTAQDAVTP